MQIMPVNQENGERLIGESLNKTIAVKYNGG
jgi:hypothetical protein